MTALAALVRRDIQIALRVGGGALIGVLFFLIVVVLMPFAIGPDLALLTRLGPAILWLGALLASLLTLDRLFMADHEDGSLDLIAMSRTPLELTCAAKALAHWLAAGLPLIVATPVLGLLLNLDASSTMAVALTLLVGTPALTFTGMIGAALAVTLTVTPGLAASNSSAGREESRQAANQRSTPPARSRSHIWPISQPRLSQIDSNKRGAAFVSESDSARMRAT